MDVVTIVLLVVLALFTLWGIGKDVNGYFGLNFFGIGFWCLGFNFPYWMSRETSYQAAWDHLYDLNFGLAQFTAVFSVVVCLIGAGMLIAGIKQTADEISLFFWRHKSELRKRNSEQEAKEFLEQATRFRALAQKLKEADPIQSKNLMNLAKSLEATYGETSKVSKARTKSNPVSRVNPVPKRNSSNSEKPIVRDNLPAKRPTNAIPAQKQSIAMREIDRWQLLRIRKTPDQLLSTLLLGEGGFGAVIPVIQLDYGPAKDKPRKGALKVLKNRNVTRSEFEAFQSEMVRLSGLRHQNIAMLYDWPKENKELWFVMELVGESNLHDLCAREKLVPKVVLKYTLDLFYALRYLHEVEKLVHFDIKPLNIGVRDDRSAIALLDFGLSFEPRREEPKHPPTIEYCPPELFKPIDQNYDYAATDVYSAAISIIQMVTGKIPWDATRAVSNELIAEICNRGPSWAGINNNGLIHFLKPLLHFDPKRRPTAAEVVEHLEKNNFAPWTDAKYRKVAESYDDMRKRAFAK